jgi:hypothetical protein
MEVVRRVEVDSLVEQYSALTESNKLPRFGCIRKLGRSLWIRKPCVVFHNADIIVITKLGAAWVHGQRDKSPARRLIWPMRVEYSL